MQFFGFSNNLYHFELKIFSTKFSDFREKKKFYKFLNFFSFCFSSRNFFIFFPFFFFEKLLNFLSLHVKNYFKGGFGSISPTIYTQSFRAKFVMVFWHITQKEWCLLDDSWCKFVPMPYAVMVKLTPGNREGKQAMKF